MSAPAGVLGVQAVCRLDPPTLHSGKPRGYWPAVGVCKVCKVFARARTRARFFIGGAWLCVSLVYSCARTGNPYTPYTPYTLCFMALFLLVFLCVGVVLGKWFLCWVGFCVGVAGHE